jgi:hypothetical protein
MYSLFVLLYVVGLLITPVGLNVIFSSASLFGCLGGWELQCGLMVVFSHLHHHCYGSLPSKHGSFLTRSLGSLAVMV